MRAAIVLLICVLAAACDPNLTPQPSPLPTLPSCTPTNDGTIDAAHLPVAIGVTLDFFTTASGATRSVTLSGSGSDNVWDLGGDTGDTVMPVGPVAIAAQWYAASFPSSQFVVAATYGADGLDGVFHQDDVALWLDGTASRDEAPPSGKTLIVYAAPVAVLRFPLADGVAFTTTAAIPAGVIDGLPFIGTDTYAIDVAGTGQLELPDVAFDPVLRVRTLLTRTPSTGTPVVSTRTTDMLFQCFGEIAHVASEPDEPNPDFTNAALVQRFALGR
jgi:hypothetical protein